MHCRARVDDTHTHRSVCAVVHNLQPICASLEQHYGAVYDSEDFQLMTPRGMRDDAFICDSVQFVWKF